MSGSNPPTSPLGRTDSQMSYGAQTSAPSPANIKAFSLKKNAFTKLKVWHKDWVDRTKAFEERVDPMYSEVMDYVQIAKQTNSEIARTLRDRIKLDVEYAKNIRNIGSVKPRIFSSVHHPPDARPPATDGDSTATAAAPSSSIGSAPTETDPSSAVDKGQTVGLGIRRPSDDEIQSRKQQEQSEQQKQAASANASKASLLEPSMLKLQPSQWSRALSQMHLRQALAIESFTQFVDTNLIEGLLQKTVDDFNKRVDAAASRLKESKHKMTVQNREARKLWEEYDKIQLQNERIDLDTKVDKQFKDHRDCWLYERRFLTVVGRARALQRDFFKTLVLTIEDLRAVEAWRSENFLEILNKFVWRLRDALGATASAVGSAHAQIDPEGYNRARTAFMASAKGGLLVPGTSTAGTSPRPSHLTTGGGNADDGEQPLPVAKNLLNGPDNASTAQAADREDVKRASKDAGVPPPPTPPAATASASNPKDAADESAPGIVGSGIPVIGAMRAASQDGDGDDDVVWDEATERRGRTICAIIGLSLKNIQIPRVLGLPKFVEAAECLEYSTPPESLLVIKQGTVHRQSGISAWQQKWANGVLVLTWDRYLHMFRSHDDSSPAWSTCMAYVELRRIDDPDKGLVTVELREKKNSFLLSGSKSNYFRALSPAEVSDWLKVLWMACTADDLEYTARALTAGDLREKQRNLALSGSGTNRTAGKLSVDGGPGGPFSALTAGQKSPKGGDIGGDGGGDLSKSAIEGSAGVGSAIGVSSPTNGGGFASAFEAFEDPPRKANRGLSIEGGGRTQDWSPSRKTDSPRGMGSTAGHRDQLQGDDEDDEEDHDALNHRVMKGSSIDGLRRWDAASPAEGHERSRRSSAEEISLEDRDDGESSSVLEAVEVIPVGPGQGDHLADRTDDASPPFDTFNSRHWPEEELGDVGDVTAEPPQRSPDGRGGGMLGDHALCDE